MKSIIRTAGALLICLAIGSSVLFVSAAPKKIEFSNLSKKRFDLQIGTNKKLAIKNMSDKDIVWSTSNKKVATVSSNGKVTGKSAGAALVTASLKKNPGVKVSSLVYVAKYKRNTYRKNFYYTGITPSIQKRIYNVSYKKGCKVPYSDLRYIRVKHYDFNGKVKTGELIVNKKIAEDVVEIFYELYQNKYPIASMKLIDEYKADDEASMKVNNTSAFNYRVMTGSNKISKHGYGLAIDINPIQNPYVKTQNKKTVVTPIEGKKYLDRTKKQKGMITKDDLCYKLFIKHGFTWGGNWNSLKDYQHFEK